jgi:hypothetical protein
MARPIPMPPPGMAPKDWIFCVEYGEQIELIVTQPGFFDHATDEFFDPELPTGDKPAGVIGPLKAVKNGDVVIGYLDSTMNKLFLVTLKVQSQCS